MTRSAWHRPWVVLLTVTMAVGAVVMLRAVHDLEFELDGNVVNDTGAQLGTVDWADFFNTDGSKKTLPANFTASTFIRDFVTTANGSFGTSDTTTFTTGSKDTLQISTGWQCTGSNNVNSKVDLINTYAAAYTDPHTGHQVLYFGLERNDNSGNANVGFWFLQDAVSCATTGTQSFVGNHKNGDLLIVSAFTNGGVVSTIDVYQWQIPNPAVDPVGALNQTPVAHGVDCRASTTGNGDTVCATSNTGTISTPWLTAAGRSVGHSLLVSEFFEGGLDLTLAGLGGHCFNTFLSDTRSSQSLTATLFDFGGGVLGECTSSTVTQQSVSGGSTSIPVDPNAASISVTDTATVSITGLSTGAAVTGSVAFHLCGPSASTGTDFTCGSGGVAVGSAKSITATGQQVTSDAAIVTSAGRYCWRADFTATSPSGIPSSTDNTAATECFIVTPAQPTLSTQATSGPVTFGSKISDSVTLSGTAHEPGTGGATVASINPTSLGGDATGAINITAFGPDSCNTVAYTSSVAISASGDGVYGGAGTSFEFQPTAPGQYVFVASYAGDSPNTLGVAAGTCQGAPSSEKVTVQQISTGVKTKQSWTPNDTVTVTSASGNLGANGSVAFSLYTGGVCTGTAVFSQTVAVSGGVTSQEVSTNNTSFTITTLYTDPVDSNTALYSWKVVYTPNAADTAHTGSQSSCNAEHFQIKYTNDPGQ